MTCPGSPVYCTVESRVKPRIIHLGELSLEQLHAAQGSTAVRASVSTQQGSGWPPSPSQALLAHSILTHPKKWASYCVVITLAAHGSISPLLSGLSKPPAASKWGRRKATSLALPTFHDEALYSFCFLREAWII